MSAVYDSANQVPPGLVASCRPMPLPTRLLMCPPAYFDVVDVKNPHMEGQIGRVDPAAATRQWQDVKAAFERCGARVDLIDPLPGCEDMVFCANQTFAGLDAAGRRICLLSRMKHASRRREVPAFAAWFEAAGYRVEALKNPGCFEGSGDAIWHPGRGLIWGGWGHRSDAEVYPAVADLFGAPVIRLKLLSERFYHLDTCFCPLSESVALVNPRSLEPRGMEMIRAAFATVIECPPDEADAGMACNATAIGGRHVVIQRGNPRTVALLHRHGLAVHEVDTSEFLKSGGSVFCMKMYVF
jgi:N-dimethylarginine dimethylaminohydrolase